MQIIGGCYRGYRLQMPKGNRTRPTASRLREALFNICQNDVEGAHVLDLFAGSGAIGLEALSRGAASATFVELDREAISCIKKNAEHLQVADCCHILHGNVFVLLNKIAKAHSPYRIIYADPPYGAQKNGQLFSSEVISWVDAHPQILVSSGSLFVEEEARYSPCPPELTTLHQRNSRQYGHSLLHHLIAIN